MSNDLHNLLLALETKVYTPEVRRSPELCAPLFADDFLEFGSNGKVFDKAGIVEVLVAEKPFSGKFVIEDFVVKSLAPDLALATYRLDMVTPDGDILRQSLRSTIYRLTDGTWQQIFHQGTKMEIA